MTVAALLFADTFPIGFTDNLISSAGDGAAIDTPITPAESRPGLDGFRPAGLAKKHWKSEHANHYVLYAGVVKDALSLFAFIEGQTAYAGYDEATHSRVVERATADRLQVSFIVVTVDRDNRVSHHYHHSTVFDHRKFGRVVVIGSGKEALLQLLDRVPALDLAADADPHRMLLNALVLAGAAADDYVSARSNFAALSTGGHFPLVYFPELYGWNETSLPAILEGFTQLHVVVSERDVTLEHWTHTAHGLHGAPLRITSFHGTSLMSGACFQMAATDVRGFVVADTRAAPGALPQPQVLPTASNQLLVHATMVCPHQAQLLVSQPFAATRGSLVSFHAGNEAVTITLHPDLLAGFNALVERLRRGARQCGQDAQHVQEAWARRTAH